MQIKFDKTTLHMFVCMYTQIFAHQFIRNEGDIILKDIIKQNTIETKQLYYDDFNKNSFSAKVISCKSNEDKYEIVLDQTAFYPAGGGMNADTGSLNGCEVLDVVIKNNKIVHILGHVIEGDDVKGEVNLSNRISKCQIHTAQHVLTALFDLRYDIKTDSLKADEFKCDLFLSSNKITQEMIDEVEFEARKVIYDSVDINTTVNNDGMRYVNIKSLNDFTPCGCLTLTNTSQIIFIKILKSEVNGSLTKITFSAGYPLMNKFEQSEVIVSRLKETLSSEDASIVDSVKTYKESHDILACQKAKKEEKLYLEKVNELYKDSNSWIKYCGNSKEAKKLAEIIKDDSRDIKAVLQIKNNDSFQYIIVKSKSFPFDLNDFFTLIKEKYNFLGGRKENTINGKCSIDLLEVLE